MADLRVRTLILQEFRLSAVDADGAVARIVDATSRGLEPAVPLLTSIDDRRDVATIRGLRGDDATEPDGTQRAALDAFLSAWQSAKYYVPRIAERSQSAPTHYRLAVTESGINDEQPEPPVTDAADMQADGALASLDLLWVGRPSGDTTGLLVLVGDRDGTRRSDPHHWPLPMSRQLGVRIYDSRG